MTALRQSGRLVSLLLVGMLCTGCNLLAIPYFLLLGTEHTEEPKMCKLASTDKQKTVKVLILASRGLETRPEFLQVDRELTTRLVAILKKGHEKNKEKVVYVAPHKVEQYKDEHPNWKSLLPQEIGAHFKADYVISLEIESMSLYEPGSANTLYRGRAEIGISVVDVKKAADGPTQQEYRIEYPGAKGPIPADNSSAAQFRQMFLNVVAEELSWRFVAHPIDDEQQINK